MDIKELSEILSKKDKASIEQSIYSKGFFNASTVKRTAKVGIVDLAKAFDGETEWFESEKFCFKAYTINSLEGYEQVEWIWLNINEKVTTDDTFEQFKEEVSIPYAGVIFAREKKKDGKN